MTNWLFKWPHVKPIVNIKSYLQTGYNANAHKILISHLFLNNLHIQSMTTYLGNIQHPPRHNMPNNERKSKTNQTQPPLLFRCDSTSALSLHLLRKHGSHLSPSVFDSTNINALIVSFNHRDAKNLHTQHLASNLRAPKAQKAICEMSSVNTYIDGSSRAPSKLLACFFLTSACGDCV